MDRINQLVETPVSSRTTPPSQEPGRSGAPANQREIPTISIVIPVYNAETTIERLVNRLIKDLSDSWYLQLVLVDDGSQDKSAEACRRLYRRYPHLVNVIRLSRNFGEHNAVMAGLHYAIGDYCVIMDDDFQNPPSEVAKLINEISKGYDVVFGRYPVKHHSSIRNLGSRLHNWMATHALGKPADLYLSSFKVMSRFVVNEVIQYTGPDPYLDAIVLRVTRKVSSVAVEHHPRAQGASGYTLGKLLALWGNMIVTFSLYPLRLIAAFGLVMAVVGAGVGLWTLASMTIPFMNEPSDMDKLQASNWFFRGSTLLAISIIGEYIGRIYMHLNRAPQFIVYQTLLSRGQPVGGRAKARTGTGHQPRFDESDANP